MTPRQPNRDLPTSWPYATSAKNKNHAYVCVAEVYMESFLLLFPRENTTKIKITKDNHSKILLHQQNSRGILVGGPPSPPFPPLVHGQFGLRFLVKSHNVNTGSSLKYTLAPIMSSLFLTGF